MAVMMKSERLTEVLTASKDLAIQGPDSATKSAARRFYEAGMKLQLRLMAVENAAAVAAMKEAEKGGAGADAAT